MSAARDASPAAGRAAFPWDEAAGAAFGFLRWRPADFWAATPRELAMALAPFAREAAAPPSRAVLEALIRRFPDQSN
ncbi:phage tail assembly chaperone [Antarcticirhabdus aurantiaca]|uniref:Phage tail assembly chaperone n=1 Tax=Antarcticirhabdus aurantiaca TaxID=2606717 RepID=A0ACD4NIX5_9HYPH|nr:phage tail assembly chaperone [Antarcticirhabdus aurantiaca]WAJ26696.1 phage tail assembly chaperone [Jeongeuplla avenae]